MKALKDILRFLGTSSQEEIMIKDIVDNSNDVKEGSLFLALRGLNTLGGFYIEEAKKRGAVRVLSDSPLSDSIYVKDLDKKVGELARFFYGLDKRIKLYGVTGTSGKSTLAYLLSRFNNLLGKKTLLITTTSKILNSVVSDLTTPKPLELFKILKRASEEGYEAVVMECSSIGIAKNRVSLLCFDHFFFTNIKKDHLDFHKTLKDYRNTKLRYALTNARKTYVPEDFKYYKRSRSNPHVFYLKDSYKIINMTTSCTLFSYQGEVFKTKFILDFNIKAIAFLLSFYQQEGYEIERLKEVLEQIETLRGRVERIDEEDIFIDYAHTADAMNKLLKNFRKTFKRDLIVVTGAGGNRDSSKRKDYNKSLSRYAKKVILTDDNPRYEDRFKILMELAKKKAFTIIYKREYAIKEAVRIYKENPKMILLIVGKGPEEYQIIKGIKYPFSDKKEVRRCLKE